MSYRPKIDTDRVDALFSELDQTQFPGAAVGIALEGCPVYRRGFGLANMELPFTLTPAMRMRIGSASKQFTALAFLLLCEERRASLDDTIGSLLPELHPASGEARVGDLLSNLSGIRDAYDLCWQFSGTGNHVTSAQVLSLYQTIDDVNTAARKEWIYNNGGFALVAAAVERIEDRSFEDVLLERIFTPLGMDQSLLRRFDNDFVANSATLHTRAADGQFVKAHLGTASAGQGGLVSSVDDMLRWLSNMAKPIVGSAASWDALRQPRHTVSGASTGYGLGLFEGFHRGLRVLHHPGGVLGGNAQILKAPDIDLDVVVIANRHDVSAPALANAILDCCVEGLAPIKDLPPEQLAEGRYWSRQTGRTLMMSAQGCNQLVLTNGLSQLVYAAVDGRLQGATGSSLYRESFLVEPMGVRIAVDAFGCTERLQPVEPVRCDQLALNGDFRHLASSTMLTLTESEGVASLHSRGAVGDARFDLIPMGRDLWRATSPFPGPRGGSLFTDRERNAIFFATPRTRPLRFERCR